MAFANHGKHVRRQKTIIREDGAKFRVVTRNRTMSGNPIGFSVEITPVEFGVLQTGYSRKYHSCVLTREEATEHAFRKWDAGHPSTL